ncbi:hypothetical protein I4U23_025154 [Adineta vaga]|nr:hypothetical protein I4U23_025154 [Adineta vaga]
MIYFCFSSYEQHIFVLNFDTITRKPSSRVVCCSLTMRQVRHPQRAPAPPRPSIPHQHGQFHAPLIRTPVPQPSVVHQPHPVVRNRVPQFLPVLQPPLFPKEPDFYEDEQYIDEYETYETTAALLDQQRYIPLTRTFSPLYRHSRPYLSKSHRYPLYGYYGR